MNTKPLSYTPAKEWLIILNEIGPDELTIDTVQQIQLDAMKEGMRRAANCAVHAGVYASDHPGCKVSAEAILSAAEQLTEKDLCK